MKYLAFFLFCCNSLPLFAQLPTHISFTNIAGKDGLPEEQINNITQDSRGFLWLGSKEGLIRYDGKNFKTWYANLKDSNSFQSNSITVIEEYKPNQILALSYGKLFQINCINQKITPIELPKNITILTYARIDANMWVLANKDSLYFTDNNFKIAKSISLLPYFKSPESAIPFKLYEPYILLYSSHEQKTFIYNYKTHDNFQALAIDVKLSYLGEVMHPKIYDSITKKLYFNNYFSGWFSIQLNPNNQWHYVAKEEPIIGNSTTRAAVSYNNLLLQGGDYGLYITDFKKTNVFSTSTDTDKPIASNVVQSIYKDSKNNFWLGTNEGISKFKISTPIIKYIKDKNILNNDAIKEIIKGSDGAIYLLLQNKSLCKLTDDNKIQIIDKENVIGYTWRAISYNNTIIACGGGFKLLNYNIITGKKTKPDFLQPFMGKADLVTLVFKATNGDIWYSINQGGGLVYNPAGTSNYINYTNHSTVPSFSHRHFNTAAEDSKGNIYFGYVRNHRLLKWDKANKTFEETETGNLIKDYKINSGIEKLLIDKKDNLWIIGDGTGLLKYNVSTKQGRYYEFSDGLPTLDHTAITEDGKNRIWITSSKGLCCYVPEKDKFITFTANDGLPEEKFEADGIFYDEEKNILYLGGNESLAWFNPDELIAKANLSKPQVYIDEVFSNNKKLYFDLNKKIVLAANENNLQFNIAAVDFERNSQLVFQYQLVGNNNNWIDLGENRTVNINDLSPGNYNFKVRCKYKGTDEWFETVYPFSFKIKTPWFRTWWFILLCLSCGALIIWFVIRQYYLRKLEKQKAIVEKQKAVEQERNRIAADMHDDLGSGLTRINYVTQLALSKEIVKDDLLNIKNISTGLVENMREIIWAMKDENNTVEELIFYIKNYATDYCAANQIDCIFSIPENVPYRMVRGQNRRHIFLCIKEILHNVVKHARANEVTISLLVEKQWTVLICDNGIGMKNVAKNGYGLKNIAKRMESVGGKVDYPPTESGTVVKLIIPL